MKNRRAVYRFINLFIARSKFVKSEIFVMVSIGNDGHISLRLAFEKLVFYLDFFDGLGKLVGYETYPAKLTTPTRPRRRTIDP